MLTNELDLKIKRYTFMQEKLKKFRIFFTSVFKFFGKKNRERERELLNCGSL